MLATFTVSLVFMYPVLSVLIINPVDIAAVGIHVRTSFSAHTALPIIATSSA